MKPTLNGRSDSPDVWPLKTSRDSQREKARIIEREREFEALRQAEYEQEQEAVTLRRLAVLVTVAVVICLFCLLGLFVAGRGIDGMPPTAQEVAR